MSNVALRDDAFGETPSVDPLTLSALLASRLCHDLVNPVGALGSGVEVLEEDGMDETMREAAVDLIKTGGAKSVALLKYARIAYGAAGGRGAELPLEEAAEIMKGVFEWAKADLNWRIEPGYAPKEVVKSLMILTHYASDCAPRGGVVDVSAAADGYAIAVEGARILLADGLGPALAGEAADLTPKFAPAYVAGLMARERGGAVSVAREREDRVVFSARFAD